MNNLHRELAPISDAAWAQIEEEVSRKRDICGRFRRRETVSPRDSVKQKH